MTLASLIMAVLALAYLLEVFARSKPATLRTLVIRTHAAHGSDTALDRCEFAFGLAPLLLAGLGLPLLASSWPLGLAALTAAGLLVLAGRASNRRLSPQRARSHRPGA